MSLTWLQHFHTFFIVSAFKRLAGGWGLFVLKGSVATGFFAGRRAISVACKE
jgi:hypothetical protein